MPLQLIAQHKKTSIIFSVNQNVISHIELELDDVLKANFCRLVISALSGVRIHRYNLETGEIKPPIGNINKLTRDQLNDKLRK